MSIRLLSLSGGTDMVLVSVLISIPKHTKEVHGASNFLGLTQLGQKF